MAHDVMEDLLGNLQETHRTYWELLNVADRKRTHILQNDIENLREDLRAEESFADEGARLSGLREGMHRQCRDLLNAGEGVETLDDLCRFMPAEWNDRFEEERAGLRKTIESLREVNRVNMTLVNNSLELMDGLLAALFDAEPISTYGPRGLRTRTRVQVRSLDARA